jgi:hypothetical protein
MADLRTEFTLHRTEARVGRAAESEEVEGSCGTVDNKGKVNCLQFSRIHHGAMR